MVPFLTIRIAGEGGEGVIVTGELLTTALARTCRDVFTFRTYPAEIKGGPAMFQIRYSNHPVLSVGTELDILLAFNEKAVELHEKDLKADGLLIYDSNAVKAPASIKPGVQTIGVPFSQIAYDESGTKQNKNMVALAYLGASLGIPTEGIQACVRQEFLRKGEDVLAANLKGLGGGLAYAKANPVQKDLTVGVSIRKERKLIMSGNEAMAVGAIAAGCRYYAGYPITPASSIFTVMEHELPRFGGVTIQTEDEISAITSCVGASFAGTKAMTATSGPGLSLMAEVVGLASMTETPIVVIDVQRAGPSTGMPTKMEQSDLLYSIFMSHGEAPRVVLAPSNVKDCFYGMGKAFYLAEKYQIPVVVLSDQSLSSRTQTFTWPKLENIKVSERLRAAPNGDYKRFKETENGVSPVSFPGDDKFMYVTTGLEHNEVGQPSWSPGNHEQMSAKRHRKLKFIAEEKGFTRRFGAEDAALGIISWGSTEGSVEEAMAMAFDKGIKVKALTLKMLHPLPEAEIQGFLQGLKTVLIPEVNFTGQLCQILRAKTLFPFESVTKCGGIPFTPVEILSRIEEAARRV